MIPEDAKEKRGLKKLIHSFKYPISGLRYAFKNEQNLDVHILVTVIVIILGLLLKISYTEWLTVVIIIGLVIATELINTAFEALVDLVSPNYHPLAKVVKDTAAAAVLVFAITSVIIGIIIFLPKIIILFV
jgi:diacylglycerol kinase